MRKKIKMINNVTRRRIRISRIIKIMMVMMIIISSENRKIL